MIYAAKYTAKNAKNTAKKNRGVEQLVARRAHNPEAGGSSPSPATKMPQLLSSQRVAALITKRVRQICAKNIFEPWRLPRLLPDALQKKMGINGKSMLISGGAAGGYVK